MVVVERKVWVRIGRRALAATPRKNLWWSSMHGLHVVHLQVGLGLVIAEESLLEFQAPGESYAVSL